jgi:hypothetical protein
MNTCVGCGGETTGRICLLCKRKRYRLRQREVWCMKAQGWKPKAIQAKLGVSHERMYQIIRGAEKYFGRVYEEAMP